MKLIIGNYNYSTWSLRAWLYVHYHQLPVEVERIPLDTDQMRETLEPHFSNRKVPLLIDGELEVWDSMAILEYLGEKFPETSPWPKNLAARAVARAVSAEVHSSFSTLRSEAPMNCRKRFPGYQLSEKALKDIRRIQRVWQYCRDGYGSEGPWLFGEFSIADAMYAPVVMRFRSIDVELNKIAMNYCATVNACDSIRLWVSLGFDETEVVAQDELDWPGEIIVRS
jgi:glutathione S-transferase